MVTSMLTSSPKICAAVRLNLTNGWVVGADGVDVPVRAMHRRHCPRSLYSCLLYRLRLVRP